MMAAILKLFFGEIAFECISQCANFEHCILTRTVKIKKKRFHDVILSWPVNCTKIKKKKTKIVDISEKFPNTLRFPKMYNNCFGQKKSSLTENFTGRQFSKANLASKSDIANFAIKI